MIFKKELTPAKSLFYIRKAIERDPDNPTGLVNLGIRLKQAYNYSDDLKEKLTQLFKKAIKIDPKFQEAYIQLAKIANTKDEAITCLQEAVEIDPTNS